MHGDHQDVAENNLVGWETAHHELLVMQVMKKLRGIP